MDSPLSLSKKIGLVLFAFLFIAAGMYHFAEPHGFANMLPEWVPFRVPLVHLTGILEFLLAALLLLPAERRLTGTVTAWYLVLIFPANLYAAWKGIPAPGMEETPQAGLWVRLLFQPLLIWWVLWASHSGKTGKSLDISQNQGQ